MASHPPPMEVAAANAFSNVVFGKVFSELEEKYKLLKGVKGECESLRRDLVTLAARMDDELRNWRGAPGTGRAVATTNTAVMRDLTHDIEDCIEQFLHSLASMEEGAPLFQWAVHTVKAVHARLQFATRIEELKKRVQEAHSKLLIFNPPGGGQSSSTATEQPADPLLYHVSGALRGIEKPMSKIRSLLDLEGDDPGRLRVIAIVGFGGSGKTALAIEVFNQAEARSSFDCCALVGRREYNHAGDLLSRIFTKVTQRGGTQNHETLKDYLSDKRYLIVIDDIDMKHWDVITSTFQDNRRGSRIIVTTTRQSEANRCHRELGKGYIHKMNTLGDADAMAIALRNESPSPELRQGSETLLKKCDGLPLALVSVGNQLRGQNELTGQFCAGLCRHLGSYLVRRPEGDGELNFETLRGVLMDNYATLSDHTVRACLLYLGIFPIDPPPRKKAVMRRCLAEGYARSEFLERDPKVVADNFKEFIDRNIIQPVLTSSNGHVKTCKAHGIVHEFLLQTSTSEKFILPFSAPNCQKVRHLFVRDNINVTNSTMDLSRVRSLTVSGSVGHAISDFGKYELMRVLDLEGCSDLADGHLEHICKLWNLRYLSLGPNITTIPPEIEKLALLETLDASKTGGIVMLPVEVIGLRSLIHLFGKFKLPDQSQNGAVSGELEQLSKGSNLETLAGFVVSDQSQVFPQLMAHLKKLSKVKIWCDFTGSSGDNSSTQHLSDAIMVQHLSRAIMVYMMANKDFGDVRSLSIDFQNCSEQLQNSLHSLEDVCHLSSLKLHGMLPTLPPFVARANDLIELCLQSTTLTAVVLQAVSNLRNLLYLKLIADHLVEKFVIQVGAFKSLRRLRFEVKGDDPILPEIQEGALPELVSLQLHCKSLDGSSSSVIRHLRKLKEIDLGHTVTVRQDWEEQARNHPNRPDVLPIERVDDPMDDEPTEKPVAPDEPESAPDETGSQEKLAEAGLENSAEESSPGDIPTSTNNSSGRAGGRDDSTDREPPENPVPLEASTHVIGIQQQPVEEGSKYSSVLMEQGNSTSFLPNAGNRSLPDDLER